MLGEDGAMVLLLLLEGVVIYLVVIITYDNY